MSERVDDVEPLTQLFGRELFARLERSGALPLSLTWWDDRLMEWTMADQAVKAAAADAARSASIARTAPQARSAAAAGAPPTQPQQHHARRAPPLEVLAIRL